MSNGGPDWPAVIEHLSRPATLLIEKISNAIGMLYEPTHVKKMAQAEADAALITANGEIAVNDLHRRALMRWVNEEAQKQANIESITEKAIPRLEQDAKPEQIDNDWLRLLFDKARHVSNPEMQELWAKVLARQANQAESISIHAVNTLASMDRHDAAAFGRACQLAPRINDRPTLIVMEDQWEFKIEGGSNWAEMARLEELGLVKLVERFGCEIRDLPDPFSVAYGEWRGQIRFTQHNHHNVIGGYATFTNIGWQLFDALPIAPSVAAWRYLRNRWTKQGHIEVVAWDEV